MGLLIVSADDWGHDRETTDAIRACFVAGAITSVGAMVHMSDSARAAELALAEGEPTGLHLNLTEAFSDETCPAPVRERQARIVSYMAGPSRRRWGLSTTLFKEIERCLVEQVQEFRRLYGRDPTHLDGHEHVHQSLNVMLARGLPAHAAMRPSFTFMPGEKPAHNRALRALCNRLMGLRFGAPRYFFSIRDMHPALGGSGLERKLALSQRDAVEIMTHPGWDDERALLLDQEWLDVLGQRELGSFADL